MQLNDDFQSAFSADTIALKGIELTADLSFSKDG